MYRRFKQIDVFTAQPLKGNPLAVVLDADRLDAAAMQRFADWTNLSEATFLAAPTHHNADYSVRIFCPGRELPFAGHPTLGSCHAWLEAGGQPKSELIVQECGVGLVRIRRDGKRLAFAAPPLKRSGPLPDEEVERIARGLRIARRDIVAHSWCDNGPSWRGVMLASVEKLLALKPDGEVLAGLDVGIVAAHDKAANGDAHFEVRAFFHGANGIVEDPVTGSLNAALAQWLIGGGYAPPHYIAAQGTALNRAGRVHVEQIGSDIWIGGESITVIEGSVAI